MSGHRPSEAMLGHLDFNQPFRVSSIHTDVTHDSGYVTDTCIQVPHATEDVMTVSSQSPKGGRKEKQYRCQYCTTDTRFSTTNDRARHWKTVHGILRNGDKVWKCPAEACATAGKQWPRYDNFRQHVLKHGPEYDVNLEQCYVIITDEQIGSDRQPPSQTIKSRLNALSVGRHQPIQSPLAKFEPQVQDILSEASSGQDVLSDVVGRRQQSPRSYSPEQHTLSTSIQLTRRKLHSYTNSPAQTTDGAALTQWQQNVVSSVNRPQYGPTFQVGSEDVSPDSPRVALSTFTRRSRQDVVCVEETPSFDSSDLVQDSFLKYLDSRGQHSWARSPILTAIGSSFTNQSDSSLTKTDDTRNTDSTRTSMDHTNEVCQTMELLELPTHDFPMSREGPAIFSASRREPIPTLHIAEQPYDTPRKQARTTSLCYQNGSNMGNQLNPKHLCSAEYSPDTMHSSLSEGERSFIYYDATHDADEVDRCSNPSATLFADALVHTILDLLSTNENPQYATSPERSKSRGSDQQPSTTRTQPHSSAGTNQSRKRGRGNHQLCHDRSPSGKDDEGEEEDEPSPGRSSNKKIKTGGHATFFACPFYKHDHLSHGRCKNLILRTIPTLKQHLYRKHKRPENYCFRCYEEFPQEDELVLHSRNSIQQCVLVPDKFANRMSPDAYRKIQKRKSGDCKEVWYGIYGILFPHDRKPTSPFVDDQEAVTHMYHIFVVLGPQAVRLVAQRQLRLPEATQAVFEQAAERFSEIVQLPRQEGIHGIQTSTQWHGLLTPHTNTMTNPSSSTQGQFVDHETDFGQAFCQPLHSNSGPTVEPQMPNSWTNSGGMNGSYMNQTALSGLQPFQGDNQITLDAWMQRFFIENNG